MGSCGWQEAETVMPTKGCQDSVSIPNSSSTHSLFTAPPEKTKDGERVRGIGGAEGARFGLDCIGSSDRVTGKGQLGQGNRGR